MNISTTAYVNRVEPVTSRISADGAPFLHIGNGDLLVVLSPDRLTPAEQVDFLRALSEEAAELATRVAALHAEPVGVRG